MATTTISADVGDQKSTITASAGGTAGTRGVQVIIDWSKVTNQLELVNTLTRVRDVVRETFKSLPAV